MVPFLLYLTQKIPAVTTPIPWGDPKTYNPEKAAAANGVHTHMPPTEIEQMEGREEEDREESEEEL